MAHDFAKIRPMARPGSPPAAKPPAWGLLFTGLVTGLTTGVLASFLVYSAGLLPPVHDEGQHAASMTESSNAEEAAAARQQLSEDLEQAAAQLQLEFYKELPNYEVVVNTPPRTRPVTAAPGSEVPARAGTTAGNAPEPAEPARRTEGAFMLQAGAFQQETAARQQGQRLSALGLEASIKKEALLGKTLFLVQTGPFYSRDELSQAQRLLQRNNIDSMRVGLN